MKIFPRILVFLFLLISSPSAHAFKADHFKGIYEVVAEHGRADKKYVVCDVDTLGNIWAKYAEGDLPADYEKVKDEPAIILGFTFRTGIFFNLEANALVGGDILAMPGDGDNTMQLRRNGNGTYELGVRIKKVVTFYDLGPKEPLRSQRNRLPLSPRID